MATAEDIAAEWVGFADATEDDRVARQGGDVVAVSKLLGHASISTTQRYVDHLQESELRAAVPALPDPLTPRTSSPSGLERNWTHPPR